MPRYSRPGYKKCGKMVYGDAKKALALAKKVKSMLNVEYKINDNHITGSGSDINGSIVQLSNLLQGNTNETRDGNQVKYTQIQLKYFVTINSGATATLVRVFLILDKQTNTAIYTPAQILKNITVGDGMNSPYNRNFRRRFRVLYDRVHDLSINGNRVIRGKKTINISVPVRYNGTSGSISALTENSLSFMHLSSEATNVPAITAFMRCLFVDN